MTHKRGLLLCPQTRDPPYSRHRLKSAVEFVLNAIGTTRLDLTHFRKDLERLADPKNMVERGYLLFFVRREDYRRDSGLLPLIDRLPDRLEQEYEQHRDHADNLVIVYSECLSAGTRRLKTIPRDRSSWIG